MVPQATQQQIVQERDRLRLLLDGYQRVAFPETTKQASDLHEEHGHGRVGTVKLSKRLRRF